MTIDYKKELEAAAKSMILVHEPDTLIKMIARIIVQKVKVTHAGILLKDPERDSYIFRISQGPTGVKIPAGFARMDKDKPLIQFFFKGYDKKLFADGAIIYDEAKKVLKKQNLDEQACQLLNQVLYQMEIFDTIVCIPSYFRDDLLGLLLLGKKDSGKKFGADELDFFIALASDAAMAIRNAQLFKEIELELDKKHRLFIHTTVALAVAIDAKDHYTHGHTSRVTNLSLEIAKKLAQLDKKILDNTFLEDLHIAGLLHDIGKIGIPEKILNKEGPLDEEEMKLMRQHPVIGVTILQPIKELDNPILGVKYHHERYDGSGYPQGLKGDEIPLIASIIAVADSFDAMTTDRPYRRALSKEEAKNEIKRQSGRQFHPQVANALVQIYEEQEI
jgi:HD-GYP domain-containing protein (c-di-GMP phosphodiesterase class II)